MMKPEKTAQEIIQLHPERDILFDVIHGSHDISERHWHDAAELIYITQGTLLMEVNGHRERLDAGDCILINSRTIHASTGGPGNDSILVQFPDTFLSRYIPDYSRCWFDLQTHSPSPDHQAKLSQLKTVLESMAQVQDQYPENGFLRYQSLLFELLFELCQNFRVPVPGQRKGSSGNDPDSLSPAIEYTKAHYAEPVSISDVSSAVHLDPSYFCRKFKKVMGQTYLEYLSDVRLSYIYEDLIHTDEKLEDILEKHGFTNYKLFRRVFREKFGCTPGELRKKAAGKEDTAYKGHHRIQPQIFPPEAENFEHGTVREL